MTDDDLDKLAGVLYRAYEHGESWEELKAAYPSLRDCWLRVAEAAIKAIVVVRVYDTPAS